MAADPWPWPDDRLERRTRIAQMYRDRLTDEAPQAAAEMDALMAAYGQSWVVDGLTVDADELLTVAELAELADVTRSTVYSWVQRWPLTAHGTDDNGRNQYRWGDILVRRLSEASRMRYSAATDRGMPADGLEAL